MPLKRSAQGGFRYPRAVDCFPLREGIVQNLVQTVRRVIFSNVQVQVQHGAFHPVFLQLFHCQSFEKLPLALEVGFQGRYEQALAEAARAAQEVVTATVH